MIPKKIHYVWVGYNQKTELVNKCIASWKKHLPDYQIIEWGNSEVENINNLYVQQAFKHKKWAFVSDYLRLKALKDHGGFYFDTDLEVTDNLDQFLNHEFLSGFENFGGNKSKAYPITALMACEKDNQLICNLLQEYDNEPFELENGELNLKTNTKRITEHFINAFQLPDNLNPDSALSLQDNHVIFPSCYFSTPEQNKPNYSIHHFDGSWHNNYKRRTLFKINGYKVALFIRKDNNKNFNFTPYAKEKLLKTFVNNSKYSICLVKDI